MHEDFPSDPSQQADSRPVFGVELDLPPPPGRDLLMTAEQVRQQVEIPPAVRERVEREAENLSQGIRDPELREEVRKRALQLLLDQIIQSRLGAEIVKLQQAQ